MSEGTPHVPSTPASQPTPEPDPVMEAVHARAARLRMERGETTPVVDTEAIQLEIMQLEGKRNQIAGEVSDLNLLLEEANDRRKEVEDRIEALEAQLPAQSRPALPKSAGAHRAAASLADADDGDGSDDTHIVPGMQEHSAPAKQSADTADAPEDDKPKASGLKAKVLQKVQDFEDKLNNPTPKKEKGQK